MSEVHLTYHDFPNLCRVCLQKSDDLQNFIDINMQNLYKLLTDVEIKEDVFPKNICKICKSQLDGIISFIEQCKNSEAFLKRIPLQEETTIEVYDLDNCKFEQNGDMFNETIIIVEAKDIVPINNERNGTNLAKISVEGTKSSERNCSICGKKYISEEDMKEHYIQNPNCLPDSCQCPICEKLFYPRKKLKIHMTSHRKDPSHTKDTSRIKGRSRKKNSSRDIHYKCPECPKMFARPEDLIKHATVHTGVKPFNCEICDMGYMQKRSLEEHMNFHTGRIAYLCEYCGNGFKRLWSYNTHIYHTHTENIENIPRQERKYIEKRVRLKLDCKICGKTLTSRYGYANHQLVHRGIKRFLCSVCGKKFIANAALKSHMRIHTGEKPFHCKCCGKRFSQSGSLNNHLMTAHDEIDDSLNCPHCNKSYALKRSLKIHMLSHSKEKPLKNLGRKSHRCSTCDKSFRFLCDLKTHMRVHTGEKPYSCSICERKLSGLQPLRVHMRLHTGERPYVCSVCEKGFCDGSNLRRHFRYHHGENRLIKSETEK